MVIIIHQMTQFLEKFRGRTTRVGKEGILQILDQDFKPIMLDNQPEFNKKNHRASKVRSIELDKSPSLKQKIELPPIKLNLKQQSKLNSGLLEAKVALTSRKSASRVSDLIKQKEQELVEGLKSSPLKHKKSSIITTSNTGRASSFDNVPDQFQSFEIPQDEMRFLKSFQRYTNSKHFTIHRKMSQRGDDEYD